MRDARMKEIKLEILHSEKLKDHFEENPKDLELLEHAVSLQKKADARPQLRSVPEYLTPVEVPTSITKEDSAPSKEALAAATVKKKKKKANRDALKTFKYKEGVDVGTVESASQFIKSKKRGRSSTDNFMGVRGDEDLRGEKKPTWLQQQKQKKRKRR